MVNIYKFSIMGTGILSRILICKFHVTKRCVTHIFDVFYVYLAVFNVICKFIPTKIL